MKKKTTKKQNIPTFKGVLSVTQNGYGFVDISRKNGVFVARKHFNGAFHGDVVEAKLLQRKGRPECEIIRVLERGISVVSGICVKLGKEYFLRPYHQKIPVDFQIKKAHLNGAREGELIVGTIISYDVDFPGVYVTEVLGSPHKNGNDMTVILRKYGILETFPPEVLEQQIPNDLEQELPNRTDYTGKTVITIDGDDAKDLDDAISIERIGAHYLLGVHIADVSHYVKSRTPIDTEAYHRGTSVYFPDRVAPMLPIKLSNGLCSLHPGEIKLTFSCVMKFDENGTLLQSELEKSYVKSVKKATYSKVKQFLSGENVPEYEELRSDLELFYELYLKLKAKRQQNGYVEFHFPETKFELDTDGKPIQVAPYEVSFANEMIEEFMLAANTAVADFAWEHQLPFVYRVHGAPDIASMETLYQSLKRFGIDFRFNPKPTPKELNQLLLKTKDTEYETIVHQLALRSMQKAIYASEASGHYGLNFQRYCHFTSPIRRYPDLVIHRILSDFLAGKSVRKYNKFVKDAAEQSSETEMNAFLAEREADDVKKAQYMSERIGQKFEGTVSGMCDTGFFVALPSTVEGFVPFQSLEEDDYDYLEDEFLICGRRTRTVYQIGQTVFVMPVRCDILAGKIEFQLVTE